MKRLLSLVFLIVLVLPGRTQDIPVFSQKLTNSFIYNPSVAGNTLGSATLSYRQQWTGATDAPQTTFLSLHTPFGKHKFGTGLNVYNEMAGVNQNLFASAAFAYHVRFSETQMFSMGASAEFINTRINFSRIDVRDNDDILLIENQPSINRFDVSFGMSYQTRFVKLGASANRLTDLIGIADSSRQFPAFYSGFVNFTLPLSNERDLLEPVVYVRNFSNGKYQLDAGLYYTWNNRLTLGGSYRTGGTVSLTGAFRVTKGIYVGYSREMLSGTMGAALGASNEFTLRLDFNDHRYFTNYKNARKINTSALALRRKTLKSYPTRNSPHVVSNHNQRFASKNYVKSPNYRMDSSSKLVTKKPKRASHNTPPKRHKRR